jgi:O-antigen/teichoic acid export membrane protein
LFVPTLKQAARNLAGGWAYKVFSALTAFVLSGWATRVFGLDAMSLLILANSVVAYLMLLDFGAGSALPRMLPRMLTSRDQPRVDELLSTAVFLLVGPAVVAVLISPFLTHLVVSVVSPPAGLESAAYWTLWVSIAAAGACLPMRLGFGMLAAVSRFDTFFVYESIGMALKLGVGGLVLYAGSSLPWYAAAMALPPLAVSIAQFAAGLRMMGATMRFSLFRSWALGALLTMCGASLVMTLANTVTTQGGTVLIGLFGSSSDIALFGFPLILVTTAMSFAGPFGALLSPVVSALHGSRDEKRMRAILVATVRLATVLAGLIAAALIALGPVVLPLWLGPEAIAGGRLESMATLLSIFALGFAAFVPGSALKGLLMSAGSPWPMAITELVAAAVAMLVAALLYAVWGFGLHAIAVSITLGLFVRGFLLFPLLAATRLRENAPAFIVDLFCRPLLVTIAATASALLPYGTLDASSPVLPFAALAIYGITWSIGTYWFVFPAEVKLRVTAAWRSSPQQKDV